jgi:hypothetical protein
MSDVFTLFAFDVNTNTRLCEIPITGGLTFGRRLNGAGPLNAQIPLRKSLVTAGRSTTVGQIVAPLLAYDGVPVKIYVDRDGVIVGSYLAWTGAYQKTTGVLRLGGMELVSYFASRKIVADYGATTHPSVDPAALLYQVLTDTQGPLGGAGASIGLNVVNTSAGMPHVVGGYPITQRTLVQQIIRDVTALLSPGVGGIDLSLSSVWNPSTGAPVDTATIVTPRAGRAAGQTGLLFDLDAALDYWWDSDATKSGTTILATGTGTGSAMPIAEAQAPGVPVGGLGESPRLDKVVSTTATSQGLVGQFATFFASQYGRPVRTPQVQVPTAGAQPFGSWIMGDDARLYTPGDERFPSGLDQYWRIVADDVTIPEQGVPVVKVLFNLPPTF